MSLRLVIGWLLLARVLAGVPLYCQDHVCNRTVISLQQKGMPSTNPFPLVPELLKVRVGGKLVRSSPMVTRRKPLRVSILLDIGTRQNQRTWITTKVIVEKLSVELPVGTEFSLSTFSDKVEHKLFSGQSGPPLQDALNSLSLSSGKESKEALYEAIQEGVKAFEYPAAGDVEVLVTASEVGFGAKLEQDLERHLSLYGVRLFGVSFDLSKLPVPMPSSTDASVSWGKSFSSPEAVASASGGVWVRTPVASKQPEVAIAKGIASFAANGFVLDLHLDRTLAKGEDLQVELVDGRGSPVKDVILLYPKQLYPCH
jgi:hypothetical protein